MSSQRKAPFRPRKRDEITQNFNDGIVTIYSVHDGAASGYMPEPVLTELVKLSYQERKLGLQRYYSAKQNQIHVQRVIRVPLSVDGIDSQCVAETENGTEYRIDLVQAVPDVYPPCLDLTLVGYYQKEFEPGPINPITDIDPIVGPIAEGGDGNG